MTLPDIVLQLVERLGDIPSHALQLVDDQIRAAQERHDDRQRAANYYFSVHVRPLRVKLGSRNSNLARGRTGSLWGNRA